MPRAELSTHGDDNGRRVVTVLSGDICFRRTYADVRVFKPATRTRELDLSA